MAATVDRLTFALREPDFVTAARVAQVINTFLGTPRRRPLDPGSVSLECRRSIRGSVPALMAQLETLPVETDVVARVVINERTGTVVVGGNVQLGAGGRRARQSVGAHHDEATKSASPMPCRAARHGGRAEHSRSTCARGPPSWSR